MKLQTAKLGKFEVAFADSVEYHTLRREIWGTHCYYIELENETPRILDIGSHIGLSVLYFKSLFPGSVIDAYEPMPESVEILRTNLEFNNIKGVTVNPRAVSVDGDSLTLYKNIAGDWLSTTSVHPRAWNESQETVEGSYPATPFREILSDTRYDLIKLDIEGHEYELLQSVKNHLNQGLNWEIEIHGKGLYDIREIVKWFENMNMRLWIEKGGKVIKPHQVSGLCLLHASVGAKNRR